MFFPTGILAYDALCLSTTMLLDNSYPVKLQPYYHCPRDTTTIRSLKDLLFHCEFITLSVSFITFAIISILFTFHFELGKAWREELSLCYAWPVVGIQKLSLWLDKLKVFSTCSSAQQAPSHSVLYNNTNTAQGCWFSSSEVRSYKSVFGGWSSLILMWDPCLPSSHNCYLFSAVRVMGTV